MLDSIEAHLVHKIKHLFPTFDVDSFPMDFKNYDFTNHDGCILVKYQNSSFSNQNTVWKVVQDETYEYKVIIGLRYLFKYREANKPVCDLKHLLQGLYIVNHKITLKNVKCEGEDHGDLWFSVTINIKLETQDNKRYKGGADAIPV